MLLFVVLSWYAMKRVWSHVADVSSSMGAGRVGTASDGATYTTDVTFGLSPVPCPVDTTAIHCCLPSVAASR